MQHSQHQNLVGFIWSIANKLRGPYRPPQYRRVMLPLIVLRRFDLVLAENKQKVLDEKKRLEDKGITGPALEKALSRIAAADRKQENAANEQHRPERALLFLCVRALSANMRRGIHVRRNKRLHFHAGIFIFWLGLLLRHSIFLILYAFSMRLFGLFVLLRCLIGCSGHCFAVSFPSLNTAFIIAGFPKNPRSIPIITNSLQSNRVIALKKCPIYVEFSKK